MKLYRAIVELLEAQAERVREETSTLQLGTYARGYQDGQEDIKETYGFEVAFIGTDDDDDETNDCG
jgi:hypothetical protein